MTDASTGLLTAGTLERFSAKKRDKLLEASLVLFNERGFGAVTTASIAEHAGVLEGSLWHHFRTKKDILIAHIDLLQQVFEGMTDGKLVVGANWFDERMGMLPGGILPGALAKNFVEATTASASLGFRYAMHISPSPAGLIALPEE